MSEFCLNCWNELNKTNDPPKKYIISEDLDYCDGCGQFVNVIVAEKASRRLNIHTKIFFLFRLILLPIALLIILIRKICRIVKKQDK